LPTEAEQRALRLRAGVAEVERMLGGAFDFAQLPALKEQLGRLRADGGGAIADTLATRAKGLLVKSAEAELDRGEIDGGVAHYRVALALDAHAGGEAELAAALRTRAQSALTANKDTEAVRWAREAVGLAGADPEAHALLAECLHALREDGEAVTEYEKALSARPDDRTFTHGLATARHALAGETAAAKHDQSSHTSHARHAVAAPPSEGAPAAPAEAPATGEPAHADEKPPADDKPAPSPPSEAAPDQQQ
jgi:tetratricopeptide (TPR) repeat protein